MLHISSSLPQKSTKQLDLTLIHSSTHPLTHSPTYPLTHSPTHSLAHSPTYPLTHSPTHPLTHSPTHPLILPAFRSIPVTSRLVQTSAHSSPAPARSPDSFAQTHLQLQLQPKPARSCYTSQDQTICARYTHTHSPWRHGQDADGTHRCRCRCLGCIKSSMINVPPLLAPRRNPVAHVGPRGRSGTTYLAQQAAWPDR
jgi:hypothetical protein